MRKINVVIISFNAERYYLLFLYHKDVILVNVLTLREDRLEVLSDESSGTVFNKNCDCYPLLPVHVNNALSMSGQ